MAVAMSAHTPGPTEALGVIVRTTDGTILGAASTVAVSREEAEANARLWASAPDLLAAAIQIDKELRTAWAVGLLPSEAVTAETCRALGNAITKAES